MAAQAQSITIPQAIAQALQAHRAGKLEEAEAIYRQVLAVAQETPDALHLLGVINHQRGDHAQALRLIDRAIRIKQDAAYYSNRGLARRALGDAAGARIDYNQALSLQPNDGAAHHNLARLLHDQGDYANAIEHYRRAIEFGLDFAELYTQLGEALQPTGELHPAIASFHRALTRSPEYLPAFRGLADALARINERSVDAGLARRHVERASRIENPDLRELATFFFRQAQLLTNQGELELARACLERSVSLRPDWAEAKNNLGSLYSRCGQQNKAIDVWRQALAIDPALTSALNNLGTVLTDLGHIDEAICHLHKATELDPSEPVFHTNLGRALFYADRAKEAELIFRRALDLRPNNPAGWSGLGAALRDQYRFSEAAEHFRRVILSDPHNHALHLNLGRALFFIREYHEAVSVVRRAIELAPDDPASHHALSGYLLAAGQFQEGWREHEWRIRHDRDGYESFLQDRSIPVSLPIWNGEPLSGRTIVVAAEHGYGDGIQFIRYATLLARAGAKVCVACPSALVRLFRTVEGVADVFSRYNGDARFDYRCWLMSLPRLLATTSESIPRSVPYVKADEKAVEYWRLKLDKLNGLRVGLAWAGDPRLKYSYESRRMGRRRDVPLQALAPLATIPGVRLISLQKQDSGGTPLTETPLEVPMINMTSELRDFADTAALIENLDLVISADTAVAHLAGALGKPVWLLSRYDGCWRWMAPRTDSPWYPTMRIFWQEKPGDWSNPISQVERELREMMQHAIK